MALGFDSPVLAPTVYDLVHYCVLSLGVFINEFLSFFSNAYLLSLLRGTLFLFGLLYLLMIALRLLLKDAKPFPDDFSFNVFFKQKIQESTESWWLFIRNGVVFSLASTTAIYFVWLCIALVLTAPLLIGYSGYALGHFKGSQQLQKGVCIEMDWNDVNRNKLLACTKLQINGSEAIFGHKAYATKESIYFITNDGAYELNQDMKIISFKKYINRPEVADG